MVSVAHFLLQRQSCVGVLVEVDAEAVKSKVIFIILIHLDGLEDFLLQTELGERPLELKQLILVKELAVLGLEE